jgi:hypothetical protein
MNEQIRQQSSDLLKRRLKKFEKSYAEKMKALADIKNEIQNTKKHIAMVEKGELIAFIDRQYLINPSMTRGELVALLAQKVDPNAIVNSDGDFSKKTIKELAAIAEQSEETAETTDNLAENSENIEEENSVDVPLIKPIDEPVQKANNALSVGKITSYNKENFESDV